MRSYCPRVKSGHLLRTRICLLLLLLLLVVVMERSLMVAVMVHYDSSGGATGGSFGQRRMLGGRGPLASVLGGG